jgi:hypothetical protein
MQKNNLIEKKQGTRHVHLVVGSGGLYSSGTRTMYELTLFDNLECVPVSLPYYLIS